MRRWWKVVPAVAGILATILAALAAVAAEPDARGRARIAERFGEGFLRGDDDEALEAMMGEAMLAAFGRRARQQLRQRLEAQHGEVVAVGEAWEEPRLQGFYRLRVPVRFARGELDLRVVLEPSGKVGGFFLVPHAEPPADDAEAPVEEVAVSVAGLTGKLSLPAGEGPHPAVVLVHGSGPNDMDETVGPNKPFRDLAWGLARRGVAVLRYHKRSYERPQDLAAAGDGLTVEQEAIDDARAALELLRGRPEIDGERVFVLGHSLGGTVAPRIAARPPRPAGIVVLAGSVLPLPEAMLRQMRYVARADGELSAEEKERLAAVEGLVGELRSALAGEAPPPAGQILGAPFAYWRDLDRHDPPAEAAALGLPILVLQGERDYQVTMEDFARWQEALAGKSGACLKSYAALDHLFRPGDGPSTPADYERAVAVAERVVGDVAAWILKGECP